MKMLTLREIEQMIANENAKVADGCYGYVVYAMDQMTKARMESKFADVKNVTVDSWEISDATLLAFCD